MSYNPAVILYDASGVALAGALNVATTDASLVVQSRAFVGAKNESSAYTNITSTTGPTGHIGLDVVVNPPGGGGGFALGKITTLAATEVAVRATTYTEQAANAQRSVNSTSALDTAAGTGARTVQIKYFTLTAGVIAGPFLETVTLNGVTGVNTVAANICLIESIETITAGSGGTNAGIIQLWTGLAAAGVIFASIAVGDRRTFLAHHYVPSGVRCHVVSMSVSSNPTTGNLPAFTIRSKDTIAADSCERFMFDSFTTQGSTGSVTTGLKLPRIVTGPVRITVYVTPTNATSQVSRVDIGFYDVNVTT